MLSYSGYCESLSVPILGEIWQRSTARAPVSGARDEELRRSEFESVAIPHTHALFRTAVRLTRGDLSAAEDLVQEAMLNAWRAFDQFEHGTICKAWLFRILLNLSSKRIQKLVAAPHIVSLDGPNALELADPHPTHSPADILTALNRLSDEHRSVLLLQVVEGFTCHEAAEILNLPIGTVMSRLSRAKAALRSILAIRESS